MHDKYHFRLGRCDESAAEIFLMPCSGQAEELNAILYGPQCELSRTLATQFSFSTTQDGNLRTLVTDPCYWTSKLPFTYELKIGDKKYKVGMKRWSAVESSWKLENNRYVLRGAEVPNKDISYSWEDAREAETTLLVNQINQSQLVQADAKGVSLVVDCRAVRQGLDELLEQLCWHPCVKAVIIREADADTEATKRPLQIGVAATANSNSVYSEHIDFIMVELSLNERPPKWLASADRPVVALRRGVNYSDLQSARAACDKLQAELAPEFDLAGYFVAP